MQDEPMARTRILVVDDSPETRRLVYWALGGPSSVFDLQQASDGSEALDILTDEPIDLVVTDERMPELNGIGLVTAMRDKRELASIPVIMMTSTDGDDIRERAFAAGVQSWIAKPFTPGELIEAIQAIIPSVSPGGGDRRGSSI
jgi:two-component system chemotaxis response regulator CheY